MSTCPKSQYLSTLSNEIIYVGTPTTSSTAPQCSVLRGEPGSQVNPFSTLSDAVNHINKRKYSGTITISCSTFSGAKNSTTVIIIPNRVVAIINPTGNSVIPPIQISGSQNIKIHGITTSSITINGNQKDEQNIHISNSNILSKISASSSLKSKINLVISDCNLGSNEKNTGALLSFNSKDDSELSSEIRNSTVNAEYQLHASMSAMDNSSMNRKSINNKVVSKGMKENVGGTATMSTAHDGNSYRTGASIPSSWRTRTVSGSGKFIKNHVNGTYNIQVSDAFTSNDVSSNGSVEVIAKNIISTISHKKTTTEEGDYMQANMTNQAKTSYDIDGHQLNLDGLSWNNISQKNASEFAVKFHNQDINISNLISSNVHNVVSSGTSKYVGQFLNSKLNVNSSTSSESSGSKPTSLFNYEQNDSSIMDLFRQNVNINYNGQVQGHVNNSTDSSKISVADLAVKWNSDASNALPVNINTSGKAKQTYSNTNGTVNTPNSPAYSINCSGNSQLQTHSKNASLQSTGSSINVTDNASYERLQNNCNFQGTGFTHQENVQDSGNFNLQSNSNNFKVAAAPLSSLFKCQHGGTSITTYGINGDSYEMDLSQPNTVGIEETVSGQATANSSVSNITTTTTVHPTSQVQNSQYKGSTNVTNERSNSKKIFSDTPTKTSTPTPISLQTQTYSENANVKSSFNGNTVENESSRTLNESNILDNANWSVISRNITISSKGTAFFTNIKDDAKTNYVSNGDVTNRKSEPSSKSTGAATFVRNHTSSQSCSFTTSSCITDHGGNPGVAYSSTGEGQCSMTTTNNEENGSSLNTYTGMFYRQTNSSNTGGKNTYSGCTVNQSGCAFIDAPIECMNGTTLSTSGSTLVSNTNQPIVSASSKSNINVQTSSIRHKPSEASKITVTASVNLDDSSTVAFSASSIDSDAKTVVSSDSIRKEQALGTSSLQALQVGTTSITGKYENFTNVSALTTSASNKIDGKSTIEGNITANANIFTSIN